MNGCKVYPKILDALTGSPHYAAFQKSFWLSRYVIQGSRYSGLNFLVMELKIPESKLYYKPDAKLFS